MKNGLILLALVLLLPACRFSTARAVSSASAEDSAAASFALLDPRTIGTGADRALEFKLQNTTGRSIAESFTVDWFDAHGAHVALTSTAWQRVELAAHGSQSVRVAPMPFEARSWRLRFSSSER